MKINPISKLSLFIFLLTLLFGINRATSQYDDFWSNIRFGGGLNIGFSENTFNANIAPAAVYEFNEWFSSGIGLNFGYSSLKNNSINQEVESMNYGASIITLFNPINELQISAEFEEMGIHQEIEINDLKTTDEYWYPALFVGAGFRSGPVTFGLRYDLLYDDTKSIYGTAYAPFVRVFF